MFFCKIFFQMTLLFNVWASDGAGSGAAPADGHGAKKEGEKEYSGSQTDEWQKIQKDYVLAKIKYDNEVKTLESLQAAAKANEGSLSIKELEAIQKTTKSVKEAELNYKRLQQQYSRRFPEKGLEKGRRYDRLDGANAADGVDEKPHTIDAKVKILNSKISTQYRIKPKKKTTQVEPPPEESSSSENSVFKNDGVTEKIKLEK